MSFTLLLLALSALVPNRELAAMERGLDCFLRGVQQITLDATTRAYAGFVDYAGTGYRTYLRLNEKQRRLYLLLEKEFVQPSMDLGALRAKVRAASGLTASEKDELIRILGLDEANPKLALETYRRNLQYYFWSDHSKVHMTEILERSHHLRRNAPKEFLEYFDPVLESPAWREKIESAIRIHDSRMSTNRLQHAELLLDWDSALFPTHWSDEQKALNSVLGMLLGHPFRLTADELGLVLKSPYGDIPVPPSQFSVGYGQAAIDNFVFGKSAANEPQLVFKLRLTGKTQTRILKELGDYDPIRNPGRFSTRDPHALAIAQMIQSIVNDFPPELLQRMKFQIH